MKKIIHVLLCCFFAINLASSQTNNDIDISQFFNGFDEDIAKAMEELQWAIGESGGILDTLNLQHFDMGSIQDMFQGELADELQLDQMMSLLQENMSKLNELDLNQLQELDLNQFEDLMKDFDMQSPIIPAPEQLEEGDNPSQKKKSKKKRKLYTL